jgi:hypothetical protein
MIDTVLNLVFNCSHRHLTRPFTPVSQTGGAHGETYVVCLDCAKQFAYDLGTMRIGKAIGEPHDHSVVHETVAHLYKSKIKYALAGAGVPLALLLGSKLLSRISKREKKS